MSSPFISQFGDKLIRTSDSTEISPSDALSNKDHVMIYFSAHWCPPCRNFTPILIELYKKLQMKGDTNMELVFCSLDKDEESYGNYVSDMPWLCLPFGSKESETLATKYKARGIPHLVVVNGEDGSVITMDGTSEVRADTDGSKFPWMPKTIAEIWPEQILVKKGGEDSTSSDEFLPSSEFKDKYLMLYFSASWCPPCRGFTPTLSAAYDKMKATRSDFELVFISSDRDEDSFNDYFTKKMSFCALPYHLRDVKAELSKKFGVRGIPTILMLGPEDADSGERPIINSDIRGFIDNGDFSEFPFHKKNYGSIDCNHELNDVKSLIIFHENGDDEEQGEVKGLVKKVAGEIKKEGDDSGTNVHWSFSPDGIGSKIRSITNLPSVEKADGPSMIILDIPDNGAYYKSDIADMSFENVMNFLKSPGERFQLS